MSRNIIEKLPVMLHGADYNPEQWLDMPEILERDIEMMKKAKINCVSVGIFSWVSLEPEEGKFTFEWLDSIIEKLYKNGIYTVLATPSGAKPSWMAKKYPEILRTEGNRIRNLQGGRHNHCYTSPVYREKTRIINTKLAQRYAKHPAVILWHVSNEIQGECHCELCQAQFRKWLKKKYGSLDKLNKQWWTNFWSHTYTDWEEIESPAQHGEPCIHGLNLDWKRFCTEQTVDFYMEEIKPLKEAAPEVPVTINMMGFYDGIDYWGFKDVIDIVSWDSYPMWHNGGNDDIGNAVWNACWHDVMRSMKQQPFLMMENTPSTTNWSGVSRHKRPDMNTLTAVQAIAHGSNSCQYFQWRQSRGGAEKFHSAVVSHNGSDKTRIFREVCKTGDAVSKLSDVLTADVRAEAAIIFDVQNKWAIEDSKGPRNENKGYTDLVLRIYQSFWKKGVSADIINMDAALDKYKLVIVPMGYMLRGDFAQRLAEFAGNGGTVITTFFTGMVNESDLFYLGETPACGLSDMMGVSFEDIDALYDYQKNTAVMNADSGIEGEYEIKMLCEIVNVKTAEVLGTYKDDFYKGCPVLTVNEYGKGKVYYIGAFLDEEFFDRFLEKIFAECSIAKNLDTELPCGVTAGKRIAEDGTEYIFIQNFTAEEKKLSLPYALHDLISGNDYNDSAVLVPYGAMVCIRKK
ncbi:MAG: beta-galactosidase [Porcipelethomonas sp.]